MPISSQTPIIGYVANGVTKSFAFPFAILSADDLKVKVGADVVTTGFSIAGVGDRDGGSVTFTDAPASLTPIILYREVTLDRTTDYQENGDLLAIVLDDDFDRVWMALQDQLLLADRAVRAPIGETLQELPPASKRALMALAFDKDGQPIVVRDTTDGGAALSLDLMDTAPGKGAALIGYDSGTAQDVLDESKPMANYTALRAYTGRAAGVRITQSGLAGFFQRDDADTTSADNGGTIIVDASGRRWKRLFVGAVNVKWFGTNGDGDDATSAFILAQAYCAATGAVLRLPAGQYEISDELAFPNYYAIEGDGYGTNIVLNLSAGKFCFKEAANYRYAWAIRNVRFTVKAGASTDVGAISIAKHLRGGIIENVWTYELEQPFVLGPQIYGNLRVKGIRAYRVASAVPSVRTCFYGYGEANTVFCDDMEILGSWSLGFHLNGGRVGSLTNFNVAGSTGAQMVEGIRVENYGNLTIQDGWVEQLTVTNTAAAVYVKNSSDVTVNNVNVASGSLYFDGGSDNHASAIYYGNANGGLKILNDAKVNVDASALKFQADGAGYANGQAFQIDAPRLPSGGLFKNPTLLNGIQNHVGRTNGSLVTIADNSTTFESGTLSKELTTATNFQGAQFDAPCVAGRMYTCVVRAMLVENAADLYMGQGTNTSRNGSYLYNRGTGTAGQWRTLIFTASSSTSTISFRLLVSGVTGTAKFLVDSVQIYEGVNHAEPQLSADPGFREGSATYDPPSLADGAGVTTTLTVTGAALGDAVAGVSFANDLQGITLTGWVSANNTVSVRFQNETGGAVDLASGVLRARVLKLV